LGVAVHLRREKVSLWLGLGLLLAVRVALVCALGVHCNLRNARGLRKAPTCNELHRILMEPTTQRTQQAACSRISGESLRLDGPLQGSLCCGGKPSNALRGFRLSRGVGSAPICPTNPLNTGASRRRRCRLRFHCRPSIPSSSRPLVSTSLAIHSMSLCTYICCGTHTYTCDSVEHYRLHVRDAIFHVFFNSNIGTFVTLR